MKKITITLILALSTGFGQNVTLDASSYDFGEVTVDSSAIDTLTVTNNLGVATYALITGLGTNYVLSADSIPLAASGSATFTITFTPTAVQTYLDTLIINSPLLSTPLNTSVTGTGIQVEITTSASSVSFDNTALGDSSTIDLTISNTGTGTLSVTNITSSDANFHARPTTLSLATGASGTVTLVFKPASVGEKNTTFTIYSNDPITPQKTVTGTGTGVTLVSGNITTTTWTAANSPYQITADATVTSGQVLTVDPGAEILFGGDYDLTVQGEIMLSGTVSDSISISGTDGGSIIIDNDGYEQVIQYVTMPAAAVTEYTNDFSTDDDEENWNWGGNASGDREHFDITSSQMRLWGDDWSGNYYYTYAKSAKLKIIGPNPTISFKVWTDYHTSDNGYLDVSLDFHAGNDPEIYYFSGERDWTEVEVNLNQLSLGDGFFSLYFYNYAYRWMKMYVDDLVMNDIGYVHSNNPGISAISNVTPVKIMNSALREMKINAVHTTGTNSGITVSDSKIDMSYDNGSYKYGLVTSGENSPIRVTNTVISRCQYGIHTLGEDSHIVVDNSTSQGNMSWSVNNNGGTSDSLVVRNSLFQNNSNGINHDQNSARVIIKNTKIKNSGTGISVHGQNPYLYIDRCLIANGSNAVEIRRGNNGNQQGSFYMHNSTIVNNSGKILLGRDNDDYLTTAVITKSVIKNDPLIEIDYYGPVFLDYCALEFGDAAFDGNGQSNSSHAFTNLVSSDIGQISTDGVLQVNSSAVDAGPENEMDGYMPPGLGLVRADLGMYGGPNNTVWGGTAIPDGEPVIDHVVDLPADQGGTVGIQYSASIFDYGHTGYDVTSYSFWRELDVGRSGAPSQISAFPQGPYFVTSRDNYWEQIGTMDAQGFGDYGYSAATLADSSADGIFWSKYLVVAHTPDDDIFFVSDPDSGYSVDNIPPTAPAALSVAFDDGTLTASWEDEINPDILHYDVYRDGSSFLETTDPEFTDDTFELGDSAVYTIRGVDVHDNTGEFSDPFTATYGTKGDVTWDGVINILDVTKIIYIILFPDEEVTDEEFWAGDYNSDEVIDVVDVTPVVDIILDGLLSNMENSGGETMVYLQDNTLMLTSYRPITGIQVLFSDNATASNLTSLTMAVEANQVLVYTLMGEVLQGIDIPILALGSDAVIEDIILVDNLGERVSSVLEIVEEDLIPDEFAVHQNYPNPFNPSTLIKLDVNKPMHSKISVYDIMGREVNVLVDEELQPGYHQFIWNGTDSKGVKASSGLYFILVQTPEVTKTMKATLLR